MPKYRSPKFPVGRKGDAVTAQGAPGPILLAPAGRETGAGLSGSLSSTRAGAAAELEQPGGCVSTRWQGAKQSRGEDRRTQGACFGGAWWRWQLREGGGHRAAPGVPARLLHLGLEEEHGEQLPLPPRLRLHRFQHPHGSSTQERQWVPESNKEPTLKLLLTTRASLHLVSGPEAPNPPQNQVIPAQTLTDARDYPEEVIHLLVHSSGDDLHPGESIGN